MFTQNKTLHSANMKGKFFDPTLHGRERLKPITLTSKIQVMGNLIFGKNLLASCVIFYTKFTSENDAKMSAQFLKKRHFVKSKMQTDTPPPMLIVAPKTQTYLGGNLA